MPDSRTQINKGLAALRASGLGLAAAGTIAAAMLVPTSGSAQDTELSALTFTDGQVRVGRSAYGSCASCHGDDLGGQDGPPLVQTDWRWFDGPVADLFTYIQTAMPLDNPGTLSDRQVAGLVAMIAEANGFVAGEVALPEDTEELTMMGFTQPE